MSGEEETVIPMTLKQRQLVRENIGLVGVHIRRNLHNLAVPRRDREREDLFQEGCLGLMQAAVTYRHESGIAFAAYALPRIHNAVSQALLRKFCTVYVPPTRRSPRDPANATADTMHQPPRPNVRSLDIGAVGALVDHRRHRPETENSETIGERLRSKYERAAQTSTRRIAGKTSTRGDRDELLRILMEERLLVPDEESRAALRSIARQTESSYARVAQCEQLLKDSIRHILSSDPEFHELRRRARSHHHGTEKPIDGDMELDLASASTTEFIRRFRLATRIEKGSLLASLLEVSPADLEDLLFGRVTRLTTQARETLLHETAGAGGQVGSLVRET